MCRAGMTGRRCPSHSTNDYVKRASARRKANRQAKKALVSWSASIEDTETAEAVAKLKPSQIPSFLAASGLKPEDMGIEKVPGYTAGLSDADALKAYELGEKFAARANDRDFLKTDEGKAFLDMLNSSEFDKNEMWDNPDKVAELHENFKKLNIDQPDGREVNDMSHAFILKRIDELEFRTGNDAADKVVRNALKAKFNLKPNELEDVHPAEIQSMSDEGAVSALAVAAGVDEDKDNFRIVGAKKMGNGFYCVDVTTDDFAQPKSYVVYDSPDGENLYTEAGFSRYGVVPEEMDGTQAHKWPVEIVDGMTADEKYMFFNPKNKKLGAVIHGINKGAGNGYGITELASNIPGNNSVSKTPMIGFASGLRSEVDKEINKATFVGGLRKKTELVAQIAAVSQGKTMAQREGYAPKKIAPENLVSTLRDVGFGVYSSGENVGEKKAREMSKVFDNWEEIAEEEAEKYSEELDDEGGSEESQAWERNLKSHEIRAIKEYTGADYSIMSRVQKSNFDNDNNAYVAQTKQVTNSIHALEDKLNEEPRMLLRGVALPRGMNKGQAFEHFKVGDISTTTKITSTSHKKSTAEEFAVTGMTMVYHTRKGADVDSFSHYGTEAEVIVAPGTQYVLTKKEIDKNGRITLFFVDK